jgi:hypothetical protein
MIKLNGEPNDDETVVHYITRTFSFEKGFPDNSIEEINVTADFTQAEDGDILGDFVLQEDSEITEEDRKEIERLIKENLIKEFGEVKARWVSDEERKKQVPPNLC